MRILKIVTVMMIVNFLYGCTPASTMLDYIGQQRNMTRMAEAEKKDPALQLFREKREKIYAHMKRYGINRSDAAALQRLYKESPAQVGIPYDSRIKLASEDFFNPGEHYRIEIDEYILTMKMPKGNPIPGSWIWPYNNIRTPEAEKILKTDGSLTIAGLSWYTYNTPAMIFGKSDASGVHISYKTFTSEEREKYAAPENLKTFLTDWQKKWMKTSTDINKMTHQNSANRDSIPTRIVLSPESVVINGRIWIREMMSNTNGRLIYSYRTILQPGRVLLADFSLPKYKYSDNSNPTTAAATYPESIQEAITRMNEMVASLRIAKINDDGAPDPFVIERVAPGPLPVREPL